MPEHLPLPLPGEVAVRVPLQDALVTSGVVNNFRLTRLVRGEEGGGRRSTQEDR